MRIGKLRKITGFWKELTFSGNICRMRSALSEYLIQEGLKSFIEDGLVIYEFDGSQFCVEFNLDENYPECVITYQVVDEEYEKLDMSDKTYIADKINTDTENHCTVYTFNDTIKVSTSFYFTGKKMMLTLFCKHFLELTESLDLTITMTKNKLKDHKMQKGRRIGFYTENYKQSDTESEEILVVAKA